MAEPLMLATVGAAGVDAALSAGLLAVYVRSYLSVKAPFTLGLVLFAAAFIAQNALALYAFLTMMEIFPGALGPYMLGIMGVEGVALAFMLVSANR